MKISNEERKLIFHAYSQAQVKYNDDIFNNITLGIGGYTLVSDDGDHRINGKWTNPILPQLLLKPLSAISQVEAVEVAKIINRGSKYSFNVVYVPDYTPCHNYVTNEDFQVRIIRICDDKGGQHGYIVVDMAESGFNKIDAIDYLRSKSYNIGYGQHSPSDLISSGIVIEKGGEV